jgi:hypothetical protein
MLVSLTSLKYNEGCIYAEYHVKGIADHAITISKSLFYYP